MALKISVKNPSKKVTTKNEVKSKDKKEVAKAKVQDNKAVGKYVIFDEGGYFTKYRLYANNGQCIIISEAYTNKKACIAGIDTLKKNLDSLKVVFEKDKKDVWCFRLITAQGRPLAQSANYKTQKDAERASMSFQKFVGAEKIVDDDGKSDDHYEVQIFHDEYAISNNGKFVIYQDDGDYYYELRANNGQILCSSQAYSSEKSCREAMENFRKLVYEGNFYIYVDKRKHSFFKLYSNQLRLVMTGETYKTRDAAVSAAKSVLRFAKDAKL